ncbi:MAG: glutamine amidotransferase [Pirellulales bacterium]
MSHELVWGALDWSMVAIIGGATMAALLVWGYLRAPSSIPTRVFAAVLKALGVAILAVCLLEPLASGTRVRPGANSFVILADNSQSMVLRDQGADHSRAEQLQAILKETTPWSARLREDFEVRRYAYDSQLRAVSDFAALAFDGGASALAASLERLARRYQGRPLAGVLLFTDGNATDAELLDRLVTASAQSAGAVRLPRIYPVLIGGDEPAGDTSVDRVSVTQTSFEDAPVSLAAQIHASGYSGRTLLVQLLDEAGEEVERQKVVAIDDPAAPRLAVRFPVRPREAGVSFYQIRVAAEGEERQFEDPTKTTEATLANNVRLVAVDRGQGPYEVLYVSGRPNWEYKFLRRALEEDDQIRLVGLVRIAKREPKFSFRSRDEDTNPLFRGFDPKDKEQVEQYDQPVIVRLGTEDEVELRDGFPKAPEDLYRYHAIVLDDLESEFFTQDQMLLIKDFVRQRGGGLLMLGGQESFKNGKFERTPIGDVLPVYLDDLPPVPPDARYQLALSREGWLAPWVRLRSEENAERVRLRAMPPFQTLNRVRGVKPGATILVSATTNEGRAVPAVVEQRFGRGRAGAVLIGDLWRWSLRRAAKDEEDLEKSWRQTIRWLVGDVPKRVEIDVDRPGASGEDVLGAPITLSVTARDEKYSPLENAAVTIRVSGGPHAKPLELTAEPSDRKAGVYETTYVPRQPGAYRAHATVKAADGSDVGDVHAGWTSEPAANEFRELRANREVLQRIADRTGGEVVAAKDLDRFVETLPTRAAEITEPYVMPLWHRPGVFLLAIACLVAEWGLRRWKGLP